MTLANGIKGFMTPIFFEHNFIILFKNKINENRSTSRFFCTFSRLIWAELNFKCVPQLILDPNVWLTWRIKYITLIALKLILSFILYKTGISYIYSALFPLLETIFVPESRQYRRFTSSKWNIIRKAGDHLRIAYISIWLVLDWCSFQTLGVTLNPAGPVWATQPYRRRHAQPADFLTRRRPGVGWHQMARWRWVPT